MNFIVRFVQNIDVISFLIIRFTHKHFLKAVLYFSNITCICFKKILLVNGSFPPDCLKCSCFQLSSPTFIKNYVLRHFILTQELTEVKK